MLQSAPPPPSEVKVRTMRSDLESMARSGGGLPRFENVKVAGLALEKKADDALTEKKKMPMVFLIGALVVVVLAILGFFAYEAFFGKTLINLPGASPSNAPAQPVSSGAQPSGSAAPTASPSAGAPVAAAPFTHASLFKKPADQTVVVTFPADGAVESANDLESYNQRMMNALAAVSAKSNFVEIDAKSSDGADLGIADLLAKAGANILDPQFLAQHFNPDATFFAYRDKSGFWPGYVISLRSGENWLFLKNDAAKLESSASISNIFIMPVGNPAASGFQDAMVASTTARALVFDGTPSATFIYGWTGNNLIISASPAGFAQAIGRL